jgi:hypothetical protein
MYLFKMPVQSCFEAICGTVIFFAVSAGRSGLPSFVGAGLDSARARPDLMWNEPLIIKWKKLEW